MDHILSNLSTMTHPSWVAPRAWYRAPAFAMVHRARPRVYPTSEVRDSNRECQAAKVQGWLRGATPRLRSGAVAGRCYPVSKVRGSSRESKGESAGAAQRRYTTSEVKGGGWEELPHVRGQGL